MKTTIEFKDGRSETTEGVGPSVYCDELSLLWPNAEIEADEIPLDTVSRIVFEND